MTPEQIFNLSKTFLSDQKLNDPQYRRNFNFLRKHINKSDKEKLIQLDSLIQPIKEKYLKSPDSLNLSELLFLSILPETNENTKFILIQLATGKIPENGLALYILGHMYRKGIGIAKNMEKAIELLNKAADLNNTDALSNLANIYKVGEDDVKPDDNKQFSYLRRAKNLKSNKPLVYYHLAKLYWEGRGTAKDEKYAERCYCFAVNLKSTDSTYQAESAYELGKIYFEGSAKIAKDDAKAKQYLNKALEFGLEDDKKTFDCLLKIGSWSDSKALHELGIRYFQGRGVTENVEQAIAYFNKAADLENMNSLDVLSCLYFIGDKVVKDVKRSFTYSLRSANLKSVQAYNRLAHMYFYGIGTPKNISESVRYAQLAGENNDATSLYSLGIFHEFGIPGIIVIDHKKASEYYLRAAKLNHRYAIERLKQPVGMVINNMDSKNSAFGLKTVKAISTSFINMNSIFYFNKVIEGPKKKLQDNPIASYSKQSAGLSGSSQGS